MVAWAQLIAVAILVGQGAPTQGDAQARRIRELIQTMGGASYREGDMLRITPADTACDSLVRIGKPAIPYLLEALKSPEGWSKVHAMEVLAKLHAAVAVRPMVRILRTDRELGVRAVAANSLGPLGDRSVIPDLLKAAASPNMELALGAWRSLGQLRAAAAVPILVKHLDMTVVARIEHGNAMEDPTVVVALIRIGKPAVPALKTAFRTLGGESRTGAALALGGIGSKDAVAALKEGLKHRRTRDAAERGLAYGKAYR